MERRRALYESLDWFERWTPSWWDRLSGRVRAQVDAIEALYAMERSARRAYVDVRMEEIANRLDGLQAEMPDLLYSTRALQQRTERLAKRIQK